MVRFVGTFARKDFGTILYRSLLWLKRMALCLYSSWIKSCVYRKHPQCILMEIDLTIAAMLSRKTWIAALGTTTTAWSSAPSRTRSLQSRLVWGAKGRPWIQDCLGLPQHWLRNCFASYIKPSVVARPFEAFWNTIIHTRYCSAYCISFEALSFCFTHMTFIF